MPMRESVNELVTACMAAHEAGADFPRIWREILSPNALVLGMPIQRLDGARTFLEVRLLTGQRLLCDTKGYALA